MASEQKFYFEGCPFELIYDDNLLPIHEINYDQKGRD